MTIPSLGTLIKARPWPVFVIGAVLAVSASLIRDLIHQEGTIRAGEGVAIAVTLAAGICATWALVVSGQQAARS